MGISKLLQLGNESVTTVVAVVTLSMFSFCTSLRSFAVEIAFPLGGKSQCELGMVSVIRDSCETTAHLLLGNGLTAIPDHRSPNHRHTNKSTYFQAVIFHLNGTAVGFPVFRIVDFSIFKQSL